MGQLPYLSGRRHRRGGLQWAGHIEELGIGLDVPATRSAGNRGEVEG
ncbi:MAG: hypothetical protein GTN78_00025 [Gemmatimonadales bacterium]|nr:hypothetical protein [Gemmatimonadales bacterium]